MGTHPSVHGPVHAVPCPFCGKPNDFREIIEHLQVTDQLGEGSETGQKVVCDECGQTMEVAQVKTVIMVQVRKPTA